MSVRVEQIMGLPISITVRGDGEDAAPISDAPFKWLRTVDAVLSPWKPESDLSRFNRGVPLAELNPLVTTVWNLCLEAREQTGGWFDAWIPREGAGPGSGCFNPTGLVKGWALECATELLAGSLHGEAFCINGGGDVVTSGGSEADPWVVGIEKASDPSQLVGSVTVNNGAVCTSGTYARGSHLLAPSTREPVPWTGSISVTGPSLMWTDVWATAAFVSPEPLTMPAGYGVVVDQRAGVY